MLARLQHEAAAAGESRQRGALLGLCQSNEFDLERPFGLTRRRDVIERAGTTGTIDSRQPEAGLVRSRGAIRHALGHPASGDLDRHTRRRPSLLIY
jgi:hypothetical protein